MKYPFEDYEGFDDEDNDLGACPFCGWAVQCEQPCSHFVATVADDADVDPDSPFPLYLPRDFGLGGVAPIDHLYESLMDFFELLERLGNAYRAADSKGRKAIDRHVRSLSRIDQKLIAAMFKRIKQSESIMDDETGIFDYLESDETKTWFRDLFVASGAKPKLAIDYEMSSGPGFSWGGTNFWSENAAQCGNAMHQLLAESQSSLSKLLDEI